MNVGRSRPAATDILLQAVSVGGLSGLFLGLYLGIEALINQPATGISVLRFYTRDIFQLLYLPALACLGLGIAAGLLCWLPALFLERRKEGAGLGLLAFLLGGGSILTHWWSSLIPPGVSPGRLLHLPPMVFSLLSALVVSLAAGGARAAAVLGLRR